MTIRGGIHAPMRAGVRGGVVGASIYDRAVFYADWLQANTFEAGVRKGTMPAYSRAGTCSYWDSDGLLKFAGENVIPIWHTPYTKVRKGALHEVGSSNELTQSNDIHGSWLPQNCTSADDQSVGPAGLTDLDRITETNDGGNAYHYKFVGVTGNTAGTKKVFSAFFEAGAGGRQGHLACNESGAFGNRIEAVFTLSGAGSVAATNDAGDWVIGTPIIERIGSSLYRVQVPFTLGALATSTTVNYQIGPANGGAINYQGDGTGYIDCGYAQVEPGLTHATSYIHTTGSVEVRGATSIINSSWAGPIGTVIVNGYLHETPTAQYVVAIHNGYGNRLVVLRINSLNDLKIEASEGGTDRVDFAGDSLARGDDFNIVCRTKIDDYKAYMNGALQGSDTDTAGVIAVPDTVQFCNSTAGSAPATFILGGAIILPNPLPDGDILKLSQ